MTSTARLLAALLVWSVWVGCAAVQPWERGRLAHDCMEVPVDPVDAAFYSHVGAVREGSTGGLSSSGGGCGCN